MFDTHRNSGNCGAGQKMVEYLYGEIGDAERESFEIHLENCADCAEELASLSSLRISIAGWKEAEPHPLNQVSDEYEEPGFLDSVSAWLLSGFGAKAFAAAAAIVLLLVIGLFALMNLGDGSSSQDVAGSEVETMPAPQNGTVGAESGPTTPESPVITVPETPESASAAPASNEARRVETATRPRKRTASKPSRQMAEVSEPPRLSEVASEEIEDDSLRLTDLFTDVSED